MVNHWSIHTKYFKSDMQETTKKLAIIGLYPTMFCWCRQFWRMERPKSPHFRAEPCHSKVSKWSVLMYAAQLLPDSSLNEVKLMSICTLTSPQPLTRSRKSSAVRSSRAFLGSTSRSPFLIACQRAHTQTLELPHALYKTSHALTQLYQVTLFPGIHAWTVTP